MSGQRALWSAMRCGLRGASRAGVLRGDLTPPSLQPLGKFFLRTVSTQTLACFSDRPASWTALSPPPARTLLPGDLCPHFQAAEALPDCPHLNGASNSASL